MIRAPFSGRLGIREVNLGQYLAPGTRITVLESTKIVFVDFTLPQEQLGSLKLGMPVRALDTTNNAQLAEGTLSAIDPAIDTTTRTVKGRASIPNRDNKLQPGMFVKAEIILPQNDRVTAVPTTALIHAAYGDSVFVVESKPAAVGQKPLTVARQQFVRPGETRGDFVDVLDGVKSGDEVVTSGAFKLRNGSSIVVNNSVKLDPQLSPQPVNR